MAVSIRYNFVKNVEYHTTTTTIVKYLFKSDFFCLIASGLFLGPIQHRKKVRFFSLPLLLLLLLKSDLPFR